MSATDFNKIWQVGANWPITTYWALKFRIFEKQGWQRPPYWKFEKLLISATALPIFMKFGTMMQNESFDGADCQKKLEFQKSKTADGRHFRHISATV